MAAKVSILWVNYNSMAIIDIVSRSLRALGELDYPDYEVIIVDNGSTDGSFEVVRSIAQKLPVRKRVIRLTRNLGFTGGNNIAYRARSPNARYIVLLNNDAVPHPESLGKLVECLQSHGAAAAQGVLIDMATGKVDTAGDMLSELLVAYQAFHGRDPASIGREFYITFADGAYSIYSVEALKKALRPPDDLFYGPAFAYFDDVVLGLQLWNAGFKIISCPIKAGWHRRSSTFGRIYAAKLYHQTKGYYALNEITNSRYKALIKAQVLRKTLTSSALSMAFSLLGRVKGSPKELVAALIRGYRDGVKLGKAYLKWRGPLNLYRAPLLTLGPLEVSYMALMGVGVDYLRRKMTELLSRKFERALSEGLIRP